MSTGEHKFSILFSKNALVALVLYIATSLSTCQELSGICNGRAYGCHDISVYCNIVPHCVVLRYEINVLVFNDIYIYIIFSLS